MSDGTDVTRSSGAVATEAQEVALAKKVVLDLSKAIGNMRFYLPNNPLVVRSKTAVYEEISSFLETFNTMSLDVTEAEIRYKKSSVYEREKKAQSLAFFFYRDGLRRITFHKGLSSDEMDVFLELVCDAMNSPEDEMDIVGSMWNADFFNIEYIALEPFIDSDEKSLNGSPPAEKEPPVGGNAYESAAELEGQVSASFSEVKKEEAKASTQLLGTLDSEEIRRRIESRVEFSPLSELGDILLDLFELEDKPLERRHLLNLVEEYVKELVSQERFGQAAKIIPEVKQTLQNIISKDEHFQELLDLLLENLTSAVCSQGMRRETREAFPKDPAGVLNFLEAVGPGTMPVLLELIPLANDVQSRVGLRNALFTLASKDISRLSGAVSSGDPQIAREAVAVIARIADPRGVTILRNCLKHRDASVRTQAVHALEQIDDPESSRLILEFLKDADVEVRTLAAKNIDISKDESIKQAIINMIASRSFRLRPAREKIAIIEILKRAKPQEAVPAFAHFFRRGFFRRTEEDSVITAVIGVLASIGTESARKLLKQGSKWRRRSVATECLRSLRQFQEE